MKPAFVVVDEFYEDPDAIVERALALEYTREKAVNYPGVMAETFQDLEPIMSSFSALLAGLDIKYRGIQGSFRVTTERDTEARAALVHLDSSDFSAVVHLSRRPAEGTSFYRHKRLGLEYVTAEDNRNPEVKRAIEEDTLDLSAWDLTHVIPMKYNRLVLFDGKHFHSGPQRLEGVTLADGRMTQNFFFYRA